MKKQKSLLLIGIGIVILGMLTGCTTGKNPNVEEGMQALSELNYEAAMEYFKLAEENGENERLIARGRGIASIGMTDYTNGAAYLEEALSTSDGILQDFDYDVNYYLAIAYIKNNQPEKAEAVYSAILALKEDDTESYYLRGTVRLFQKNLEAAKSDFDMVVKLEPQNYDRVIRIYESLSQYGYEEAGKEYLTNALGMADKMSAYDRGRLYYYLGEYQSAYLSLEEAKNTGKAEAYLYLGKAYEATGDYNYASTVYNSYIAKDTSDARIYNQLGLCEMKKGDYQAALLAFQAGMQVENNDIMQTLQFNEIVAYEYLQDYTQAEVLMDYYLKTYPDDLQAQREYEFLLTR